MTYPHFNGILLLIENCRIGMSPQTRYWTNGKYHISYKAIWLNNGIKDKKFGRICKQSNLIKKAELMIGIQSQN